MGARLSILPLLLAVLSQGLVPHLHVFDLEAGSASTVRLATTEMPAADVRLDPPECLVCRSGNGTRAGLAARAVFAEPVQAELRRLFRQPGRALATSELVRLAAPPRAPPV
jgi:hypothetical protein